MGFLGGKCYLLLLISNPVQVVCLIEVATKTGFIVCNACYLLYTDFFVLFTAYCKINFVPLQGHANTHLAFSRVIFLKAMAQLKVLSEQ